MNVLMLLILAATVPRAAGPAEPPPPTARCAAATQPLTIDGKLDEPAWADVPWTSEFVSLTASDPQPPRTRGKFSWDERHLYVAAELAERDVWAAMKEHDAPLYRENAFELFIDPDGDGAKYLELQVNPLNTTFDLIMSSPYAQRGRPNAGWNAAGLRTAVHVEGTLNDPADEDRSWTVEMAIPWAALEEIAPEGELPPKAGSCWRVNMARTLVARGGGEKTRYATWSPIGDRSLHVPQRWGAIEFIAPPPPPPAAPPPPSAAVSTPAPAAVRPDRTSR